MSFEDGALKIEVALRIPIRVKLHDVCVATGGKLSKRERQVLPHLLTGKSGKEIARDLGIAPRTAKFHVSNILAKAGVQDRKQLMAQFIRGEK